MLKGGSKETRKREREMHGTGAGRCEVRESGGMRGTAGMGAGRYGRNELRLELGIRVEALAPHPGLDGLK